MSIEVKIEARLKDTKAILTVCAEDHGRIGAIRKGAMRGASIGDVDMKWMVRTLVDVLSFKLNVLELWIEDDTQTLKTGYQEGRAEPQLTPASPNPAVAEAQEEASPEDVKAAEELSAGGVIVETVLEEDLVDRFPAEPALEGMDRIHQLLN